MNEELALLFFHHPETLRSSGSSAPSGTMNYLVGRSLVFLPSLQAFFLSRLVSSAKCFLLEFEASLCTTVTDVSVSPARGREEEETGAANGPWQDKLLEISIWSLHFVPHSSGSPSPRPSADCLPSGVLVGTGHG